jgi:hypothetical protein
MAQMKIIKESRTKILLFLLGVVIFIPSILLLLTIIRNWKMGGRYDIVFQIVVFIFFFSLGIAMILSPWKSQEFVSKFIKVIMFPIGLLVVLGKIIITLILAYLVLAFLIAIPIAIWLPLQSSGIAKPVNENVIIYTILTFHYRTESEIAQ